METLKKIGALGLLGVPVFLFVSYILDIDPRYFLYYFFGVFGFCILIKIVDKLTN